MDDKNPLPIQQAPAKQNNPAAPMEKLKAASLRVRAESMKVNREFEKLPDQILPDDRPQ